MVTRWGGCEILRSGGSAGRGAQQDPITLCRAVLGQREQSEGREPWGTQEKTDQEPHTGNATEGTPTPGGGDGIADH